MSIVFISPSKYIQGSGEMDNIGAYTAKLGKKALCVISKGGYARQGSQIEASFAGVDADVIFDYFNGECSMNEIIPCEQSASEITPDSKPPPRNDFGLETESLMKISTPLCTSRCWQLPLLPLSLAIPSLQEVENTTPAALDPLFSPVFPYFSPGTASFRAVPVWPAHANLLHF